MLYLYNQMHQSNNYTSKFLQKKKKTAILPFCSTVFAKDKDPYCYRLLESWAVIYIYIPVPSKVGYIGGSTSSIYSHTGK